MKPFVKRQKNDAADAAAIAEAAQQPNMHYVEVKSAENQARAVAFRTHQCFVRQRTQLINALRGHLGEFGIVVAQGPANLTAVIGILADETNDLPAGVREIGQLYLDQIRLLTEKIDGLMLKLREATKTNEDMRRLCTIPGVGPVTAASSFQADLPASNKKPSSDASLSGEAARTRAVVIGPKTYRLLSDKPRSRRPDTFKDHWEEMSQTLEEHPDQTALELLVEFQARYPGRYSFRPLHTLQKRVRAWRQQPVGALRHCVHSRISVTCFDLRINVVFFATLRRPFIG